MHKIRMHFDEDNLVFWGWISSRDGARKRLAAIESAQKNIVERASEDFPSLKYIRSIEYERESDVIFEGVLSDSDIERIEESYPVSYVIIE